MAKQVLWTQQVLESFIEKALLTEDEEYIMRTRCRGMTVVQQAIKMNKSESAVNKMISVIKIKYDAVQKEFPDLFPERRYSIAETYMDKTSIAEDSKDDIFTFLDELEKEYPYKVIGNPSSYSPYNEGWQDALDRVRSFIEYSI